VLEETASAEEEEEEGSELPTLTGILERAGGAGEYGGEDWRRVDTS
jgi:hypothetical protein